MTIELVRGKIIETYELVSRQANLARLHPQEFKEKLADQILVIPELLIKDDDQSLPDTFSITWGTAESKRATQRDMLKAGWVKVKEKSNG